MDTLHVLLREVEKDIIVSMYIKDMDEKMTRIFYQTRSEAEYERQRGERIYYKPEHGFYNVKMKERDWRFK